jgi:hypothetical protein
MSIWVLGVSEVNTPQDDVKELRCLPFLAIAHKEPHSLFTKTMGVIISSGGPRRGLGMSKERGESA